MTVYTYKTMAKSGSNSSVIYGINSGAVSGGPSIEVGTYTTSSGLLQPLVYINGQLQTISNKSLSSASVFLFGVNDFGQTVGSYQTAKGEHGFVYDYPNNKLVNVADPAGSYTQVSGINDAGKIVGTYYDAKGEHGFTAQFNSQTDKVSDYHSFDVVGAQGTSVMGVDNKGDVVGNYFKGNVEHAFVEYASGTFKSFTITGATSTSATGINDSGEITGTYTDAKGVDHGFVLSADGTTSRVNDPFGTATFANGINDAGQVVGQYETKAGKHAGFVATPVKAELAAALFDAALGGGAISESSFDRAAPAHAGSLAAGGDSPAHAAHAWRA